MEWMNSIVSSIDPLLDSKPVDVQKLFNGSLWERAAALKPLSVLAKSGNRDKNRVN